MPGPDIAQFKGIAPNVGADADFAAVAEGVDLSGGTLRGFPAPELASYGHSGEFTKFNGAWISGGSNYLPTTIEGADALIFKQDGEWRVIINGTEAPLWVNAPVGLTAEVDTIPAPKLAPPTILTDGATMAAGTVNYYARYLRMVDGVVVGESPFSTVHQVISGVAFRAVFNLPVVPSIYGITHLELYRRRSGETAAGLVVRVDTSVGTISDTVADAELGELAIVDPAESSKYTFQYLMAWVRNVGGWITESAPSALVPITTGFAIGAKLTRPTEAPDHVEGWRIYRISTGYSPTVSFQLVADLTLSSTSYVDRKTNFELGDSLASQYTSETGAVVAAGVPDEAFEGMIGPVNGYFIGWNGENVSLCEPGNPSWWPGAYTFKANAAVVGADNTGDRVMIVTEAGVQWGYGVSPDMFSLSSVSAGVGGVGRRAVDGGYYVGVDGIYSAVEGQVANMTQASFPASYFKAIRAASDLAGYEITLRSVENRLIMAHATGALCYDDVSQNWVTFSAGWDAIENIDGFLHYRNGANIYQAFAGPDLNHFVYTTGRILAGSVQHKFFEAVRLDGTGAISVAIEANGSEVARDTLDLDSTFDQDRYLYLPNGEEARAINITLMGGGTVRSIHLDVYDAESEAR